MYMVKVTYHRGCLNRWFEDYPAAKRFWKFAADHMYGVKMVELKDYKPLFVPAP